jgi:hypothetical protein
MKWYWYILIFVAGIVLILSGIYCGIKWYKDAHAESYIVGSINITNKLSQESFSYSAVKNPIQFYHNDYDDTDTYSFTAENLPKVPDFNGLTNTYEIVLNKYLILDPTINAGGIVFRLPIDFYGIENNLMCSAYMDISIRFLTNRTELSITTQGNENSQFLQQYINDNGFELYINKIIKGDLL